MKDSTHKIESMLGDSDSKQNKASTPPAIVATCTIGVLGTIPTLLLWTTEVAYMVGQWYLNLLVVSTLLIWISLVGVWKMKKWAAITYSLTVIVTQIVLFRHNVMWSYASLIVPVIVLATIWYHFDRMT